MYRLSQTIDEAARKSPEKIAFICGSKSISYAELSLQTNQLAQYLLNAGVKKGDRVGVYLNRCLDIAIAIYGIMKAGCAYVPLDTSAPASRTNYLLNECGIQYVVSNSTQKRNLKPVIDAPSPLLEVIGLETDWEMPTTSWESIFETPIANLHQVNTLDQDLAYIIFTSGSTGTPKGIMHTHRSGMAYAQLSASLYGLNENDRIGNHASLHFDISTLGFLTGPLVGATTVIAPEAYTKMPVSLANLIEEEEITVWYSVPLALIQLLQSGVLEEKKMKPLRWVLFGGEVFPTKHLNSLIKLWPQCQFSNVYGPAEVNQCTYYNFNLPLPADEPIPIGQVWGNTEGLIVDENDQEVSEGETGELLIRSATMMLGYWNQPELTEKSLFKRTTTAGISETFYRTGDLVRADSSGSLLFLGRKDRQVKIRGYRVELDDVAHSIMGHEAVEEVGVIAIDTNSEEKTLHAYIILKQGRSISDKDLTIHLKQSLPNYAIPSLIQFVVDLPRNSNGKIDHKKLKKIAEAV